MMSSEKAPFAQAAASKHSIESLSEALSFRISRLSAINERSGSQYFRDELGVSLSEWRVLGLVAEFDPATTSSVRESLLMDRGLLSRIVKELCARDLLISQPSPTDKRQTQLFLTPQGWQLHRNCIAFTNERNGSMASVLTPKEQSEFGRMLDLLIKHNVELLRQRNLSYD